MAAKRRLRFSSVAGPSPKRGRAARGDDDEEEEQPPQEPDESEEEAPPAPPPRPRRSTRGRSPPPGPTGTQPRRRSAPSAAARAAAAAEHEAVIAAANAPTVERPRRAAPAPAPAPAPARRRSARAPAPAPAPAAAPAAPPGHQVRRAVDAAKAAFAAAKAYVLSAGGAPNRGRRVTTTIPFAYVLAGVAVLAFGGAFTLQARRHAPPRALDASVLRHARASRAATLLGSARRRAEALASKRSALAAAKRDLQQATFAASETRTKADAHAQGWARFVAVKERAAAAKAAAEAAAAGAAAAATAATGAREAVAAAFQRAQDAVKPRRGGEVITAEAAAARAAAANDKIEAAMDSGVFSSSERAAKKALAAAAALTEAVDARRAYEPQVSDDVRNALHAAAERAASDDLRAVDVARKHVEAAARARAGAYDYASSRAGGVVVNATAPPTLKSKVRGFLKLEPGPSMVISSRAVNAARCWGFAGDQGRVLIRLSRPAQPEYFVLEHAPKAHGPRRLEAAAPREFSVTGFAVDGSATYDLGAFAYDADGPAAQRFPAKFLPRRPRPVVAAVEVSVASNQGAAATKLCRFRVH
ncbi:unnamed protein product [Pelagomonas calceolata]|uniref:SUN domain-containing protein n=1 Tax=Pelagomonas calceolata TaxID=35677 RepID=A0A8J2SC51_9STRA|nr:unnamed protein product [Pelagomonas calceolata]